jgi:hypothetical protein
LEGRNPGEERLRGEGNTELKDERTRWRVKPLKVAERGKRSGKQLAVDAKWEPGGNIKRGAGVGRRTDSSEGKPLEGRTPGVLPA